MKPVVLLVAAGIAIAALSGCDGSNSVTVRNESGRDLERLSLAVGDKSFALGPLADGTSRSVSFIPDRDASLRLCVDRGEGEACADYGYVTPGLPQAHRLEILPDKIRYTFD